MSEAVQLGLVQLSEDGKLYPDEAIGKIDWAYGLYQIGAYIDHAKMASGEAETTEPATPKFNLGDVSYDDPDDAFLIWYIYLTKGKDLKPVGNEAYFTDDLLTYEVLGNSIQDFHERYDTNYHRSAGPAYIKGQTVTVREAAKVLVELYHHYL